MTRHAERATSVSNIQYAFAPGSLLPIDCEANANLKFG